MPQSLIFLEIYISVTSEINDAGKIFAAVVNNDTGGQNASKSHLLEIYISVTPVSTTPAINLPPVSTTTPVVNNGNNIRPTTP